MKPLVNTKTKRLFCWLFFTIILFTVIVTPLIFLNVKHAATVVLGGSLCMSLLNLIILYHYFKEENLLMEQATMKIKAYIKNGSSMRIDAEDEGELNRLFHEINLLISILNAHTEKEKSAKLFLKDTIATISHQLKTPLAALTIYNGIMQEEAKEFPIMEEFITLSEQELDRIETLVQNLLKITKLDAKTILIDKSVENVSEMMNNIEHHFLFRGKQEGKQLELFGDSTLALFCDCHWLIEAISNIVKNAFDHTQKGDTIRIEWKQMASVIQIMIKDNGSGIHSEDLYHIFKRFYRSQFSKENQGVGLGLPLAKAIIEEHSGTIEVESELGFGTTFIINFLIPTKM